MSLNCNEINAVLEELNLEGSFIQDIIQPGYDTVALYTYKAGSPKTVLVCTAQNECRINETRRKITKNAKPLRFMEFLRSRIKGSRIDVCEQIGLERIIKMNLSHGDEKYIFYIRLWNNAANFIVCDQNNTILETMFRRPAKKEVTGETFLPPEPDEKKLSEKDRWEVRSFEEEIKNAFGTTQKTDNSENQSDRPHFIPETLNQKIDWWYSEHAASLSREALLEKAEKWYNITRSKKETALQNLINKQESFSNSSQIKHQGDLILSYGHLIDGSSKFLECEDYETGKTVRLLIDPKKTAQENAADYYKKYKKAQSGAEELTHDIEIIKNQIKKLDEQYNTILTEKNPVKIEQLLRKDSTPKQQVKKSHPGIDYNVNGWQILVGRDANENDELLRHHVRGEDLWLHVRDYHGGYVFIKAQKNKTVPLEILLDAGNLAVYFSKARNNGTVDLYYTHVKYLRRAKNGPKGLVIPTQEKNLCIKVDKQRLSRLDILREEAQL